ncbi:tape measure protein [Ralstonia pickettii]|nr:tape measure protein [Ralstonia pickettii]
MSQTYSVEAYLRATGVEEFARSFQRATESVINFDDAGKQSGRGLKTVEDGLSGITDTSSKAETGMQDVGDSMESLHDSGSSAGLGIDTVDAALGDVIDSGDGASASVTDVDSALQDAGLSGENAGTGINTASDSLDNVEDSGSKAADQLQNVEESTNQADLSMGKLVKTIAGIAAAVGVFNILRNAVDLAFKRIDTMEQFERVMTEMTGSTTDANAALDRTNEIVTGTAYGLDVAAASVQDFVTRGASVEDATSYIEAWGDAVAFYGKGSNEQFANVANALQNMLTKGTVGMDQLNRLFEAGIPAVDIYAQATSGSVDEISDSLSKGEITAEDFVKTVTTAMMEGTNGVTNISGAAKEAGTSWSGAFANMGAATARGVTAVIQAIDGMLSNNGLPTMRDMVGNFGSMMESTMKSAAAVIEPVGNALFWLLEPLRPILGVMKPLVPVIGAMVAAFTGMMIVTSINTALVVLGNTLMKIAVIKNAVAVASAASSLAMATFRGATIASANASTALTTATVGLRAALSALMGPVGWVITAAAGVTAGIVVLSKAFSSTSEETEHLKEETESLGESTDSLVDSMKDSAGAYRDRVRDIDSARSANSELVQTIDTLSEKENKSVRDKRDLSVAVSQLNGEIAGLNLTYNEEADLLSESTDKLQARIDLMAEQDKANAAQERLTEILKEQQDIELQLDEVNALREHWNSLIENGGKDAREAKKHIKDLDEQEENLIVTLEALGIQYEATHKTASESSQNVKDIISNSNQDLILSYEDLEGKTKEAFDAMADRYTELKDAATNAFQKINEESSVTAQEMFEILEHNQEMVAAWGENHAKLMAFASENGYTDFMLWLDNLGIDSAAELQTVADMSEEQLERFAQKMDEGGMIATEAFGTSLGEGFEEVVSLLETLVDRMETTLRVLVNEADWEEYGIETGSRVAEGLGDSASEAEASATYLGERVGHALELVLSNYDFESLGEKPPIDITGGMGLKLPHLENTSKNVGKSIEENISSEVKQSDFEAIGSHVTTGLKIGLSNGENDVGAAGVNLARPLLNNFRSELGIRSPSTVFKTFGTYIVEGLISGINNGQSSAVNTIIDMVSTMVERTQTGMENLDKITQAGINKMNLSLSRLPIIARLSMNSFQNRLSTGASGTQAIMSRLSTGMVSPFSGLNRTFSALGFNAMAGFNSGLNGGAGRVLSTARGIANSVAATMRSALRINSPSKVMELDVGRWIPEGIALGIEKHAGKVYSVIDAISDYIAQPINVATPDIAGQINSIHAQSQRQFSYDYQNEVTVTKQPANINLMLGKRNYKAFVEDITNEQNQSVQIIKAFNK